MSDTDAQWNTMRERVAAIQDQCEELAMAVHQYMWLVGQNEGVERILQQREKIRKTKAELETAYTRLMAAGWSWERDPE